ncbi:MAG TPA: hypothetical protein VK550_20280 [Polyangiaceae bacterium]|nr:hypothetical protein [Polyangiaceae bacterium]
MSTADSRDGAGIGGAAGNAGRGDAGSPGNGGTSGTSVSDAAVDSAATGSGGAADASTTDGMSGASGQGGNAGAGGTSMSDGAAGIGGATGGQPDAADGAPGTQPGCASVLAMVDRELWIAFDSDRDGLNRNLYMMHPDRSGLTQLTKGMNVDREPSFSYDGTRLSYTSMVDGKSQIFILNFDPPSATQLTHRPEGADESSFSRDGQWVAFHSGAAIYIIKTDGTGERLVVTVADAPVAYRWPAFSVDGTELAFEASGIFAVKLDGTDVHPIAGGHMPYVGTPAVSPSGVDVAASLSCDGASNAISIWMSPFATNSQYCKGRRITPVDGLQSERPTWGTGLVLAYHRFERATNRAVIAIISAVDSQPCVLTSGPEDSRNPSWSQPTPPIP